MLAAPKTIIQSIGMGDIETLRILLLQGIDFKFDDFTPLVYAVQCKQIDAVRLLLLEVIQMPDMVQQ